MQKKSISRLFTLPIIALSVLVLAGCGSNSAAGLFLSTDAGSTYQPSNVLDVESSLVRNEILDLVNHPTQPQIIFAAVNAQGIVMSSDGGQSWQSTNLSTGTARELAVHPQTPSIIYAAYEQQVITTQDNGQTFETLYAGPSLITSVAIDSSAPSNLWVGTQTGEILKSANAGRSWSVATTFRRAVTDILVSPVNGAVIVGTQGQGLHVSADQGKTFEERTPNRDNTPGLLELNDSILQIAQSAQAGSPLLIGTDKGVFSSQDNGLTWKIIQDPLSAANVIMTDLVALPNNNTQIFLLAGNTVAKSDDGGNSWFTRAIPTDRLAKTIVIIDPSTWLVGSAGEGASFVERVI